MLTFVSIIKSCNLYMIKCCDKMSFYVECLIRKYRSNVAETCYVGITGYRMHRRPLRQSRLVRHVEQSKYTCYR